MNFPELSLDLSPPAPAIFPSILRFSTRFPAEDLSKVKDFINGLEEELSKIQAFRRELPLSFLLLNDAIDKLKEEGSKYEERRRDGKFDGSVGIKLGKENDEREKKSWMSSVQLWSPRSEEGEYEPCKYNEIEGAFSSFREAPKEEDNEPGLSLGNFGLRSPAADEPGSRRTQTGGLFAGSVDQTAYLQTKPSFQTARKQRRCWSPDLHRRFVDALEKLGGSQVATPKQIRELMQVDGLTNDEVKSHLQKYRLHVRKLPASSTTTLPSTNLGMGRDELELGCSKMDLQHSGSPKGPLQLGRPRKCNSSSMEEDEEEKSDGRRP